jgi:hypothetical protein
MRPAAGGLAVWAQPPAQPLIQKQPQEERPMLLITTVEIGEGRSASIQVREGDDTLLVAAEFCKAHGLPPSVVEPLAMHLQENIDATDAASHAQARPPFLVV